MWTRLPHRKSSSRSRSQQGTAEAEGGDEPAASSAAAGAREAESRRLLVNASTIPEYLSTKYPIPEGIWMAHAVTKDKTLPHFQARLGVGVFKGKLRAMISESS